MAYFPFFTDLTGGRGLIVGGGQTALGKAERLLAFGPGGLLIVYVLAPALDNLVAKLPQPALLVLCLVLVGSFAADVVYSSGHPNMGEGVTDIGKDAALEAGR